MDAMTTCSGCHQPLPANAPQGLCPECLLKAGLGTGVGWASVFTNTTPASVLFYTDPDSGGLRSRFYRAFQFPYTAARYGTREGVHSDAQFPEPRQWPMMSPDEGTRVNAPN